MEQNHSTEVSESYELSEKGNHTWTFGRSVLWLCSAGTGAKRGDKTQSDQTTRSCSEGMIVKQTGEIHNGRRQMSENRGLQPSQTLTHSLTWSFCTFLLRYKISTQYLIINIIMSLYLFLNRCLLDHWRPDSWCVIFYKIKKSKYDVQEIWRCTNYANIKK